MADIDLDTTKVSSDVWSHIAPFSFALDSTAPLFDCTDHCYAETRK